MIVILVFVKSTPEKKNQTSNIIIELTIHFFHNHFEIIISRSSQSSHSSHFRHKKVSYGDSKVIDFLGYGGFNDIDKEIWLFKILKF